jgi:hyperosmotically inducible periplasmic protein
MIAPRCDDVAITSRVETALQDERSLRAPRLVVATEGRVVRLSGAVCSQAHIDTAARIARAIGGVLSVRNELSLMPH